VQSAGVGTTYKHQAIGLAHSRREKKRYFVLFYPSSSFHTPCMESSCTSWIERDHNYHDHRHHPHAAFGPRLTHNSVKTTFGCSVKRGRQGHLHSSSLRRWDVQSSLQHAEPETKLLLARCYVPSSLHFVHERVPAPCFQRCTHSSFATCNDKHDVNDLQNITINSAYSGSLVENSHYFFLVPSYPCYKTLFRKPCFESLASENFVSKTLFRKTLFRKPCFENLVSKTSFRKPCFEKPCFETLFRKPSFENLAHRKRTPCSFLFLHSVLLLGTTLRKYTISA
jgi:hypothetical protein